MRELPMRTLAGLVAAGLTAALLGGCGYSTKSLHPEDVRTVAVPIWQRGGNVYRRDLEFQLAEALTKRLQQDTPYRIADRAHADTILEGRITEVSQRVMSFNPDFGTPRDIELVLSVDFTWTDLRTGENKVERRNIRQAGVYYPSQPLTEDFFEGSEDAVNRLARQIVEAMEKPW